MTRAGLSARDWAGRRVAFVSADPQRHVDAVAAALEQGCELVLATPERFDRAVLAPLVDEIVSDDGVEAGAAAPGPARPGLVLLTSGTTGPPRPVHHPFAALRTLAGAEPEPERWLVTYLPGTYAWTQVVLLGLTAPGHELVVPRSTALADAVDALLHGGATAVPSTPTFWRYVLAVTDPGALRGLGLRRVTLGGERADQAILDALAAALPGTRITHVFASTETGPAFSVSDGREGFPAAFLERPLMGGRVHLRIEDGTLRVRSPFTVAGPDSWVDTGDRAEVDGDRVRITGRAGYDTINVGGQSVARQPLEDFIRALPGVRWARVHPVRAPLAGSVVGVDLVGGEEAAVVQAVAEAFSDAHVPRKVRLLDAVPVGASQKTEL